MHRRAVILPPGPRRRNGFGPGRKGHDQVRTDSASLTPECDFTATASPRQSPAATASSRAVK